MNRVTKKIVSIFATKTQVDEGTVNEKEIKMAIRKLKGFSDRDLKDIGLTRGEIEYSVRYGIAANDAPGSRNSAA